MITIDPDIGSWHEGILYYCKVALHTDAQDVVAWENDERIRVGKGQNSEERG